MSSSIFEHRRSKTSYLRVTTLIFAEISLSSKNIISSIFDRELKTLNLQSSIFGPKIEELPSSIFGPEEGVEDRTKDEDGGSTSSKIRGERFFEDRGFFDLPDAKNEEPPIFYLLALKNE